MSRNVVILFTLAIVLAIPASATVVLYTQNFEGGAIPGQFSGGTLLNTAGVPSNIGDGNWALYNDSGGTPWGTAGSPIQLQLSGLEANSSASIQFTFLAIDSWDGTDFGQYATDLFNVQANANLVFQASFRNYLETHYTGDGSPDYGSTTPPNSTITLLASGQNYLVTDHFTDSFYDIHLDGLRADAQGNLNINFFASGSGWQGGGDESFAIDNVVVSGVPDPPGINPTGGDETPEPGTWLTFSAGFAGLLLIRRRK